MRKIHALDREIEENERTLGSTSSSSVISARKTIDVLKETRSQLLSDLAYTLYFPNQMKYISLFAGNNEGKTVLHMLKARTLALAEWQKNKEEGGDRVEQVLAGKAMTDESSNVADSGKKERRRKREDPDSSDRSKEKTKRKKMTEFPTDPPSSEKTTAVLVEPGAVAVGSSLLPCALPSRKKESTRSLKESSIATEDDSFFLEGSANGSSELPTVSPAVSTRNAGKWKKSPTHGRNSANGAPVHKQQIRLQKWQAKQSR